MLTDIYYHQSKPNINTKHNQYNIHNTDYDTHDNYNQYYTHDTLSNADNISIRAFNGIIS